MLSPAQDWAVRAINAHGVAMTASRLGAKLLDRPGLDTTGKTYSPYTLGRMGGGMIMHLRRSGMVRSKKVHGITVCVLTREAKKYLRPERPEGIPANLAAFLEDHL